MKAKFCICVVVSMFAMIGKVSALSDENRPEYQKEFDAYLKDLDIISQTGNAPKNPALEADLAKMNSEEKILLTAIANTKVKTVQNNAEIMHSVEVIRVPEEFREQYADVYKEQNKTISAQSLVEARYDEQKKIAKDDSALKVSSHVNPFRFLKEVELDPLSGKYGGNSFSLDPMVDAYFNQFGRPYVMDTEPAPQKPVEKKVSKPQNNQPKQENGLQSLSLRNSMFVD